MRRFIFILTLAVLVAAAATIPASASDNQNNWHIHDGQAMPGHLGIAFFPTILGQTTADYLADPATCPNATDKALLPSGLVAGMPLRAGVCFTSTKVIHLRTLRPDEQAPGGDWTLLGPTDGGTWVTYYRVTDR
jgi:hypothetical protein